MLLLSGAWLTGFVGATITYLTSPHQKLLPQTLPRRLGLCGSTVFLAVSAALFAQVLSPATAIYSLIFLLMAAWSLGPLAAALLRRRP